MTQEMGKLPLTTVKLCELHRYHRPSPKYQELHHIVPQSWQSFWRPVGFTKLVWDTRVSPLCPTGHRNVHWHLARMMRVITSEDPLQARIAVPGRGKEYEMAYLALVRWTEHRGSLIALREAKLFGL